MICSISYILYVKPPAHAPTPSHFSSTYSGYFMALTQQKRPVQGGVGGPRVFVVEFTNMLDFRTVLGGTWGSF